MKFLRLSEKDNVGVCTDIDASVPFGHKTALEDLPAGAVIVKYGHPIGVSSCPVQKGEWVHSHNMTSLLEHVLNYTFQPKQIAGPPKIRGTFSGFLRKDGRAGIRNEIWIIPTVGCISETAKIIAGRSQTFAGGSCDGIFHFSHPYGCSQLGADLDNTQNLLAGLVNHPNAAGVLVVGLGCENNHIKSFREALGPYDGERVRFLNCQDVENEIESGVRIVRELADLAAGEQRRGIPLEKLIIGLKCGGSDAFSGITANPLVGRLTDMLIRRGGSAILAEVPEMFGAETLLMERAADSEVFGQIVKMINSYKEYYISHDLPVYENPSPGNKEGGITTLEEKSLGCIQKGGTSPVVSVLEYAQKCEASGLSLLSAPGNDLVSSTALAASGAALVLFTTGRGTPFGCPVPTVKISTNSALFRKKPHWIDFDAGKLLDGADSEQTASELFNFMLSVCEGKKTKNEINGYREMAIFKNGVTL